MMLDETISNGHANNDADFMNQTETAVPANEDPERLAKTPIQEPNFTIEVPLRTQTPFQNGESQEGADKSWTGWVELENHPTIFSTLLREWGAPTIDVQEIYELDSLFNSDPSSVYGLILLSRWVPADSENTLTEAPSGVWFANQVQSFSCATISLMNIIMNHPNLNLGEELNTFHQETTSMGPLERGWALDQNHKIRDVHNSFGTFIDKAKIDDKLQEDFNKAEKKKKKPTKQKRRFTKKRKKEVEEEENGFHFIAYVPAARAVWKMDGMERLPRKIGEVQAGENWLMAGLADVQSMWEKAMVNSFEVSLLSVVQRTDFGKVEQEVKEMEAARDDWGPMVTTLLKLHAKKGDLKELMESFER